MAFLTEKVSNGVATDLRHQSDEGVAIEDHGCCKEGVALLSQSETRGVAASSETRGMATYVEYPGCGKVGCGTGRPK